MKVIFLDVDGVLNSLQDKFDIYLNTDKHFQLLRDIIVATGAKVVLSSSWRIGFSPGTNDSDKALTDKLISVNAMFIGKTPILNTTRGDEIRAWLKVNDVEKFVILDDQDDMGDLMPYLVKTNPEFGLQEAERDKCIEMLK